MRPLVTGVVAAAVTGSVSAVITRVLMRAVSVVAGTEPEFNLVGSIGIAVVYVAILLPGCVALAWSRARWPWLVFAGGVGLLMFEAVAIGLQQTSSAQAMTPVRWVLLVVLLGAMLATYAAQFAVAARWARKGTPPHLGRSPATARVRS